MKRLLSNIRIWIIPLLLCIALLVTGVMSVQSNSSLEGNARVINYTGIVRGATQRLIKKELNHTADDALIQRLDDILDGLCNSSEEYDLVRIDDERYHTLLLRMEQDWKQIKQEIYRYRKGEVSGTRLFSLSEEYFALADECVLAAEVYTEDTVQESRNILIYTNIIFIVLAGICTVFAFYQERRRKLLQLAEDKNRQESEKLARRFQELLVPINEMSELMYISDVNTYDLLFINEAGKEIFHIDQQQHLKCYKTLQGFDQPCAFCPNHILKDDETYTWEYTNPLTKRHYLLKDRLLEWEGHPARMEIAFDITDSVNEKLALKNRLERDQVLVSCIRELYRNPDLSQATNHVLEQLGRLFHAERAYVFLLHDDSISNTAEWCDEGVRPQIQQLQNLNQEDFRIWLTQFEHQRNVVIHDVEALQADMKKEYEFLKLQAINRLIMVPLEFDNRLAGLIGLDNMDAQRIENAVTFMETLRYYVMLAMRRDEDEKALYRLSYLDELTSFYNRNRYMQDLANFNACQDAVGVVYLDLNGLKETNDHLGHDAGDELLKACANVIRTGFQQGDFYRIGGDEFVIICCGVEEAAFLEQLERLRDSFAKSSCSAAIGYRWVKDCADIHAVIRKADENMYEDKKRFYENKKGSGAYRYHD